MLEPGRQVPPFSLPDQTGTVRRFSDLAGPKGLVLYVYPKDNTSGCSLEAQEFRDRIGDLQALGFNVAGLSKDSVRSHTGFAEKYSLNFPLLSDPDLTLLEPLGAWGEKKMSGRTFMGVIRGTFVFDHQGQLVKAYPKVKAKGHAEKVLQDLRSL